MINKINKLKSFFYFEIKDSLTLIYQMYYKKIKKPTELMILRDFIETRVREGCKISVINSNLFLIISPSGLKAYVRRFSSDLLVYNQIFEVKEYQAVIKYIQGKKISIDTIIDCGGNVGYSSLFFSVCFPMAHIICIEPDLQNYQIVEKNIKINNLTKIQSINKGIWPHHAYLKIATDFRDGKNWSFSLSETTKDKADTESVSICEIMDENNFKTIDLLKIDIEGAERYLFENQESAKNFLSKTKCLAIEIHDEFEIREKIYSILENLGFEWIESGELTIASKSVPV